jgi:hypothetical protein
MAWLDRAIALSIALMQMAWSGQAMTPRLSLAD